MPVALSKTRCLGAAPKSTCAVPAGRTNSVKPDPVPGRPFLHEPLHRGIRHDKTVLIHESAKDTFGRIPWLAVPALVIGQPRFDTCSNPVSTEAPRRATAPGVPASSCPDRRTWTPRTGLRPPAGDLPGRDSCQWPLGSAHGRSRTNAQAIHVLVVEPRRRCSARYAPAGTWGPSSRTPPFWRRSRKSAPHSGWMPSASAAATWARASAPVTAECRTRARPCRVRTRHGRR